MLKEYQTHLKNLNFSADTIRNYLWSIKEYGERELTTENITKFLKENLTKYQPSSLRNLKNGLKSFSKFQKKEISWEIIKKIIPTIQPKFFTTLDKEELRSLKEVYLKTSAEINHRNNLLLDFLFYTGIRVNELVNLKHSDYLNGMLKILGKGNKVRYIFLPEFLTKYFNSYSQDYLFLTKKNKKLTTTQVRTIIYKKTKKTKINKNITPHTFRRSFATLLNNKNVRLTTIQKLLGHSQINTTANYIHNSYEELFRDYSKVCW